ncbi:MAG: MTAP family purine nucleoside phosphorylase [Methanotrichaceae archaeon]
MNADVAVIGGVGFDLGGIIDVIDTPYGKVKIWFTRLKGQRLAFISRHGEDHLPPHKINYRAIVWAAKAAGASRVISINTVGSMSGHPLGSIVLPYDFVEFTKFRPNTFFEDKAVHVDLTHPYCPDLRADLLEAIRSLQLDTFDGIYVCTEGPHLESPAQIRMMRQFGDVVGMTGYPEVVLAKELSLCYASLCVITNPACGMKTETLKATDISDLMKRSSETIKEIISATLQKIPVERKCACKDAISGAAL